jgi:chromosome partitioning protein
VLIVTANAKGGVGKSTLAVHLAAWLHHKGSRVILVDSDAQNSATQWLSEAEPDIPIVALPTAKSVIEIAPTLQADYIVADGPAGLAELTRALLIVSDLALIPCGPSALDLRAAVVAIRVLQEAQGVNGGKPEAFLVLNKLQPRTRLARDLMEAGKNLGIPAASTAIYQRQVYAESVGQGTTVWKMGRRAKDAALELDRLFSEVINGRTETVTHSSPGTGEDEVYPGRDGHVDGESGDSAGTDSAPAK